jgi:hypothetical protein
MIQHSSIRRTALTTCLLQIGKLYPPSCCDMPQQHQFPLPALAYQATEDSTYLDLALQLRDVRA